MLKHLQLQFILLTIALISYISFCCIFLFIFPNYYFVSDFNIRLSSLIVETTVFISLLYSILSRKVKLGVFWVCITLAIGCFLIGNFISAFQVFNIELPIQNFNISDVFLLFFLFFFLFAFFYKIMMECNKWEKAYLLCDLCIVVTAIFTLEWYLFNKPSANILFLSIGDVFLSFIFPIIDLLLLLLGVTLIFRPAIFNAKSKLYIFTLVLTGLAITDYLYFYLQGDLSERSVIFLRCLYRVFLLFIAIAATIPRSASSRRNYFIINPVFGEKLLVIFPYLAVATLIGFTLKEQTSSATLITGNCIAFVFVLIRHTIVRMQNKDLTETLKVFNNQLE
ncbi:diguanylate cyclase, partial [Bacillus sp. L_1B0_8]